MLLKERLSGKIVEVIDIYELTNPYDKQLVGCLQWEDGIHDPECFDKKVLCFPSGEELPQCWLDENCRDDELMHQFSAVNYQNEKFEVSYPD